MNKKLTIFEVIRAKKEQRKYLTPSFAHELLAKMPTEDNKNFIHEVLGKIAYENSSIFYDVLSRKFFRTNYVLSDLQVWSDYLGKWILWLHEQDKRSVQLSLYEIHQLARQYEYKVGDKVLYCGPDNTNKSCVYSVVSIDPDNRVLVTDGSQDFGPFFMVCWRLASKSEIKIGRRIFIN